LGEELIGSIAGIPYEIFVAVYDERCDGRGEKAREEEDTVHVALPTFCEGLVILVLLTLFDNDIPKLCGGIHVFDL